MDAPKVEKVNLVPKTPTKSTRNSPTRNSSTRNVYFNIFLEPKNNLYFKVLAGFLYAYYNVNADINRELPNNLNDSNEYIQDISSFIVPQEEELLSFKGENIFEDESLDDLLRPLSPAYQGFVEPPKLPLLQANMEIQNAERASLGTGGVWFIPANNEKIVFKPQEEENSSTGPIQNGYLKEYATYVLDSANGGFSNVPETNIASIDMNEGKGPQLGSVQLFVKDAVEAEDFGFGMFSVDSIHRIGILDIRILNKDRHMMNVLFNQKSGDLIPIDHGASFPSFDELGETSFEWLNYPQAKQPFSIEALDIIENIDIEADVEKLQLVGLDHESIIPCWMATTLLQIGARAGLNLYEIGSMVHRKVEEEECDLEVLFREACAHSYSSSSFIHVFHKLAEEKVQQELLKKGM